MISFSILALMGVCFYVAHIIHFRKSRKLERYTREVHHYLEKILERSHDLKMEVIKDVDLQSSFTPEGLVEINRLKDELEDKSLQVVGVENELQLVKVKLEKNAQEKITNLERQVFAMEKENLELLNLIESIKSSFSEENKVEGSLVNLDVHESQLPQIKEHSDEGNLLDDVESPEGNVLKGSFCELKTNQDHTENEVEGKDDELFDLFKKMLG